VTEFSSLNVRPNRTKRIAALMSGIRRSIPITTIAVVSRHYGGVVAVPATQEEEGPPFSIADPYSLDDERIRGRSRERHILASRSRYSCCA